MSTDYSWSGVPLNGRWLITMSGINISSKKRLTWLSILFLVVVAVALYVLVQYTFTQLQWESFHQNRLQAEALALRLDKKIQTIIEQEEQRRVTDYQFAYLDKDTQGQLLSKRSPLSQLPSPSSIPGLVGYFQLNANNQFSSPVTPDNIEQAKKYGLSEKEYKQRAEMSLALIDILRDNQLTLNTKNVQPLQETYGTEEVAAASLEQSSGTGVSSSFSDAFDALQKQEAIAPKNKFGRLEDLDVDEQNIAFDKRARLESEKLAYAQKEMVKRKLRKEQQAVPAPAPKISVTSQDRAPLAEAQFEPENKSLTVEIFESEVEPFRVNVLSSGHIVIFRRVWSNSERQIQGILLDRMPFFDGVIQDEFVNSSVSSRQRLAVAYQGAILTAYGSIEEDRYGYLESARQLSGTLLYQKTLLAPFDSFNVVFTIGALATGESAQIVMLSAFILMLTVLVATWLFNRYARAQQALMAQQQDFISSVSHELKTPLTSIRMYGEMLKEGWVSHEKKNEYYQFIFDESERLTRLINNVLHLAKLTRNTIDPVLENQTVGQLSSIVESKLSGQIMKAGFSLNILCEPSEQIKSKELLVDDDMFVQVMINIVDNAIKYSSKATNKTIDVIFSLQNNNRISVGVRDYGPGIDEKQLKKIFSLFYRTENELTRETKGTGIGLALVSQYVQLMQGSVMASNQTPGLLVTATFPLAK